MRYRHRWWFHLTGLPGWMRFGFFPGWMGRGQMLGPAAQYLMTGFWFTPKIKHLWQRGQIPYLFGKGFPMSGFSTFHDPWGVAQLTPEQELEMLKAQAQELKDELEAIEKRIQELGGKK